MSELLRERAQYSKGKTPIIAKYLVDHKQLFNEIAGRGFLNLPGYAFDAENDIEMAAKFGLSELNYKIMAETIERELKQTGLDYDQAYKLAMMAWEVEKQDLIEDWEAELAGIKQGMAEEEEVKERLSNEVDARQTVLITAKTAIELEMEGYRTTLAGLDGTVAPYEVLLANAKLLTAQKKLELIPIIEEIITKEGELLTLEASKATYYADLIAAEQEVATKKQAMIPGLSELATVIQEHAARIPDQISTEQAIAAEKITQSNIAVDLANSKVEEMNTEIENETKRLGISEAERDLKDLKFDNAQDLIAYEIEKDTEYQNTLLESYETIRTADEESAATIQAKKLQLNDIKNATELSSVSTLSEAKVGNAYNETLAEVFKIEQQTTLQKAAKITATLEHLVGQ